MDYNPTPTCPPRQALGTVEYTVDTVAPYTIYAWNPAAPNPDDLPFWYQPHDLNGADWPDHATAEAYAIQHINENFPAVVVS